MCNKNMFACVQVMSVKDGCVDSQSPWCTPPSSALADVTSSPLSVTSLAANDVMAFEDGTSSEVLDLSQCQTFIAASTSCADVTGDITVSVPGSNSGWYDVRDDDDSEQHTMTSLSTTSPFIKRSYAGKNFYNSHQLWSC